MSRRGVGLSILAVVTLVSAVGWIIYPTSGERALDEAALKCGISESFYYYMSEQRNKQGKLVAIEYATDGHGQDFACIDRELMHRSIRANVGQAIDDA